MHAGRGAGDELTALRRRPERLNHVSNHAVIELHHRLLSTSHLLGVAITASRTRRYQAPDEAARTIAALLTLRDQVVAPIVARICRPGPGRPPKSRTQIDRDYETLRAGMRALFHDLAISTAAA
jgi:hypothetical protein